VTNKRKVDICFAMITHTYTTLLVYLGQTVVSKRCTTENLYIRLQLNFLVFSHPADSIGVLNAEP